jgi:NAD(P)-dependent dehydrogenase (short-subunit alcohol dehydrogenase family)
MQTNPNERWTAEKIPDQKGRVAVVTGANSGIGFETAKALAARGATVMLACRDVQRAVAAGKRISSDVPGADVQPVRLDLASLASVRKAAEEILDGTDRLDLLINNAGIVWPPHDLTADGFETHIGVNHLGHFALTGHLLERMRRTPGSRVVSVSSLAHRRGAVDVDDLHFQRSKYTLTAAYGRSKLANLLFTFELQRRLRAAGAETVALAAHPGAVPTPLFRHMTGAIMVLGKLVLAVRGGRDVAMAALPTLRAATDPDVRGGEYFGPDGPHESKGYPTRVAASGRAHDAELQRRLWQESEKLVGLTYGL